MATLLKVCITLLISFNGLSNAVPLTETPEKQCGYELCPKPKDGFINVHLIPHTHDDVGWLKTVDQYFYGSKTNIQKAGVQYILDSVIDALRKDANRRFIYVETSYFWKWWMKQHDFMKHQVKKFVKNGQLEFIGGGWSMNDEATTHYQSIIDQFTWGLRKLNDTFGSCARPKVGWQIDPFGHSREMASLFAQMGYDGLLLGRIDHEDKAFRFLSKSPEMIWKGSQNLGDSSNLFTSVMFNTYSPPAGFCFDVLCNDDPIIDDKKSPDYNVHIKVKQFFDYLQNVTAVYKTDNLIITMGEDFMYQEANAWFKNLDKLILYGNQLQPSGSKFNLFYSTPSCYLKAVRDAGVKNKIDWNVKEDDFFPYSSDPNAFWTGYFTSRPTIKRFERLGNNFLQVCKQLYALTDLGPEDWADLNVLREAMGVMQHHDAVTGTEKQHVADDYARILTKGFDECNFVAATALSKIATGKKITDDPKPAIPFESCLLTNVSQCAITETSNSFIVTVYNPLSRPMNHHVRLPVSGTAYSVLDPDGKDVLVQLMPIHPAILKIPGRLSEAKYDLVFEAKAIPPLGFNTYYVTKLPENKVTQPELVDSLKTDTGLAIWLDPSTGLLSEVDMNGKKIPLTQDFLYYRGTVGDNKSFQNRSSGAYIFRPNGTFAHRITPKTQWQVFKGQYISEVHQIFSPWVSQIIRIFNSEEYIEFDWVIGPIPDDDVNGKEVITKYMTNLKTESTFYTDSNGREMLKRVRNFRPTWKLRLNEPISGNYYPVTSKILIRDPTSDVEMAILNDRAQGGSSLSDGEIELMLHRRCLHDDAFGVDEALMENAFGKGLVARGSHYLVLGPYINQKGLAAYERQLAQRKILQAWTFLSPTNGLSYADYKNKYKLQFSGLKSALPSNVQILTLEPWKGMGFLLRLEHIMEKDEDDFMSKPVVIDLKDLFAPFKIDSYRETTLAANQWLDELDRPILSQGEKLEDLVEKFDFYIPASARTQRDWISGKQNYQESQLETNEIRSRVNRRANNIQAVSADEDFKITLNPMQIRTFLIEIEKN